MQTARSLICIKASHDPHDMNPAGAFDNAVAAGPEWALHLRASSDALHGPRSGDSAVLVQAREGVAVIQLSDCERVASNPPPSAPGNCPAGAEVVLVSDAAPASGFSSRTSSTT
jgi:hypothetical protein